MVFAPATVPRILRSVPRAVLVAEILEVIPGVKILLSDARCVKQLDRKRLEAESRAELSPRGRMQKHNWKMKQELLSQKNEGKQWHAGGRKLGLIQTKERRHQKNEGSKSLSEDQPVFKLI
uniref:Uncharacterized protein n=1 Tax=Ditylenchus dipsaci TaxID=166011 RepID=A0A915E4R0_9BILA